MEEHSRVPHPQSLVVNSQKKFRLVDFAARHNNRLLSWMTNHILASMLMFDVALAVPLLVLIPSLKGLRDIVIIVSSNWIQLWALFALQRSANQADSIRQAKADADHQALTHIAHTVDVLAKTVQRGTTDLNS